MGAIHSDSLLDPQAILPVRWQAYSVTPTPGGNNYGSWAQVVIAPFDVLGMHVSITDSALGGPTSASSAGPRFLEIGTGAAGAEMPIISDVRSFSAGYTWYYFPVRVNLGERIAVRERGSNLNPYVRYIMIGGM